MRRNGIDIHCDEKQGWLSLDCQPDAFADCRDFIRQQLRGLPDIDLDKIDTIEVKDSARLAAKGETPRRRLIDVAVFVALVFAVLVFVVGCVHIVQTAYSWICT